MFKRDWLAGRLVRSTERVGSADSDRHLDEKKAVCAPDLGQRGEHAQTPLTPGTFGRVGISAEWSCKTCLGR